MTVNVVPLVPLDDLSLSERVAANIRAEIARFGLQQTDVARALGISQQSVSLKIHGKRPLSLDEIEGFARLVGLSPEDLVRGRSRPPGGPDGGLSVAAERARRDSNPQPSDPKVGPAGVDELTARRVDRERRL
ncbi:MAG: helix-turn-helix domain-containing protein, partial [Bacteroidales bacterium]|nr:helix-turn-helix domain-containing protein [Bacteroidales bacterium]